MHYRIGQIITLILLAVACAGFFSSIFFPWLYASYSHPASVASNPQCVQTLYTYFWQRSITCSATTGCNCTESSSDWRTNCVSSSDFTAQGSNWCKNQYYIHMTTFGLDVIATCLLGIAILEYILHICNCFRSHWPLGTVSFALFVALCILLIFSIGITLALAQDYKDQHGSTCNSGPCEQLFGTQSPAANSTENWGASIGWILNLCSAIFLLIVSIVFGCIGRGGDKWVQSPSHVV